MALITATEARDLVANGDAKLRQDAEEKLDTGIRSAIALGKTQCYISGSFRLRTIMKAMAEQAGYKATIHIDQRDGDSLVVEWGNKI